MASEFTKPLYNSKAWIDCRNNYFASMYGLCELCDRPGEEVHHKIFLTRENVSDSNIALNHDNLQLLCKSCHNAVHNKAYEMHRKNLIKNPSTTGGLVWDEHGNLVENKNVFIVWGAPASGKTAYVRENKGKYDIVVDLDYLMAALSMSDVTDKNEDAFFMAIDIRDLLYDLIAERKYKFDAVWIVTMLPERDKRVRLQQKLKAELIHIDTVKEECLLRAKMDTARPDKQTQYKIIEDYFGRLEA